MKRISVLLTMMVFTLLSNAQVMLDENFDYGTSTGDLDVVSNYVWTWHSGNTNFPVNYLTTSLSMTNYPSSGVGGSASLTGSNSIDANTTVTSQSAGVVYIGALMEFSSASTTEDYFFHSKSGSTGFYTRIYAMDDGVGNLKLGVRESSTSAATAYSTADYAYNTTYMVVIKHDFSFGETSLFISDTHLATEPGTADAASSDGNFSSFNEIAFRQSTNIPDVVIDGLRMAGTWEELVSTSDATELRFTSVAQGGCTQPNKPFAVEVCATNAAGSVDVTYTGDITVAKSVGAGNLSGTTTLTAVSGCVTFSDLQVDLADTYDLTATATALTSGTSGNFDVIDNCPEAFDTLTVMAYNLLFFPLGETFCGGTTTVPNRYDTLRKIVGYIKPDVLMVCELQNSTGADGILTNSLNVFGETQYAKANFITNTSPSGSGLENMFYYNSNKLTLKSQEVIQTDLRDVSVYKCYGNDPDLALHNDTTFFNFYMSHFKAGSTASDSNQRIIEAQAVRDYIDLQDAGINHIFGGDLNLNSSDEGSYQILTNQGTYALNDPVNQPGDWSNNSSFASIHTQSTRAVGESYDCGSEGGVDDRLDFLLVSDNAMNGTDKVSYIPNTYKAFGNDGNHWNQSINVMPNNEAPDSVINALYYMSDHLPVIMDLAIAYPSGGLTLSATSSNVSCNGLSDGVVSVSVSGGTTPYSYTWSNAAGDVASQTGLVAGIYTVTVQDATTLTESTTITINEPTSISVSLTATDGCADNDGVVTSAVAGGSGSYSYLWSGGQTTTSVNITTGGSYGLTVTDVNNCEGMAVITATDFVGVALNSSTVTAISCNGMSDGSIALSFGTGQTPYTYLWSDGATTQNIQNLTAGNYTVTATDAFACETVEVLSIVEPTLISITANTTNASSASASDGSIVLNVSGGTTGYSYSWSTAETTQSISGLAAGSYTVSVIDANSCEAVKSITIIDQSACNLTVTTTFTEPSCGGLSDGTAEAFVSGGTTPYSYLWSNNNTTASVSGISAGVYEVSVTDAGLCPITATITVTEPLTMAPDAGIGDSTAVCNTEFVINLIDYVSGYSGSDGSWTDVDGSGALLFGVFSPGLVSGGAYHFNYVLSGGGTCPDDSTQVTVYVVEQKNAGNDDVALACSFATSLNLAEGIAPYDTGGVWLDISATGALSDSIFNPMAAGIGTYDVQYVTTDPLNVCLNDTAFITVDIVSAPDAGTSASADLCTDQLAVDPFNYLGGTPDAGGEWTDVNNSGAFFFGNFSPSLAGEGTYNFLYTILATGCFPSMATVTFNVIGAPNAGFSNTVDACEGQVTLSDNLFGTPDTGGSWNDDDNSGAMTNGVVDVDMLTLGNSYNYTYTVTGTTPCSDASATVTVNKVICSGINAVENTAIKVFPNPNNGSFIIDLNGLEKVSSIEIVDVLGQIVFNESYSSNMIQIDNLKVGSYLVKIKTQDNLFIKRVIVN